MFGQICRGTMFQDATNSKNQVKEIVKFSNKVTKTIQHATNTKHQAKEPA